MKNYSGEQLKQIRIDRNMTQQQLAKLTDVTGQHISNIETGRKNLTEKFALKCASILNTDPSAFCSDSFIPSLPGKRLKQLRIDRNMTQRELAKKLDISAQQVSNYEAGRCNMPEKFLKRLNSVLNIETAWIVSGTGEKYRPERGSDSDDKISIITEKLETMNAEQLARILAYADSLSHKKK